MFAAGLKPKEIDNIDKADLQIGKTFHRTLPEAAARFDRGSAAANLAIEVFCRSIQKTIAAFSAVLLGLDLLVFTGGIGEHSAKVRSSACKGLEFLESGSIRTATNATPPQSLPRQANAALS